MKNLSLKPLRTVSLIIISLLFHLSPDTTFLYSVPSYPPLNLSVYVQNSTHAMVMWEDPDQDQHNGVITDYRVKLIETDTLDTFPILTVILMPLMLPDLHPFYTYQLQVAAATSVGVGPYTQLFAFRMDEAGIYF